MTDLLSISLVYILSSFPFDPISQVFVSSAIYVACAIDLMYYSVTLCTVVRQAYGSLSQILHIISLVYVSNITHLLMYLTAFIYLCT